MFQIFRNRNNIGLKYLKPITILKILIYNQSFLIFYNISIKFKIFRNQNNTGLKYIRFGMFISIDKKQVFLAIKNSAMYSNSRSCQFI